MLVLLVRSVIVYIWITISVRLMGKRQIGQLQVSELVITIIISELAALPMIEEGTPLLRVLLPIAFLCAFELFSSSLPLLNPKLARIIDGRPSFLMNNSKMNRTEMKRQRITMVDICEAMRGQGYVSLDQLSAVVLETNGTLSVIPKAEYAPAAAGQVMQHVQPQCGVPVTVVMDGKPYAGGLKFYNHDENWLQNQLAKIGFDIKEVFFMSVDQDGQIITVLRRDTK